MPKKNLKINQFHGGLNNYRDKRDTPDNALVNASNVMVDVPGKIRMMGRDMPFEQLADTVDIPGGVTPGYGVFAFKADHDISGAASNRFPFSSVKSFIICLNLKCQFTPTSLEYFIKNLPVDTQP